MKFTKVETGISDLCIIEPKVFGDDRGFFLETYNKREFEKLGVKTEFIQDNHSKSGKGVLRGLHFQSSNVQTKLVRVIKGAIYDVAVDLRPNSPTKGKSYGLILSEENKLMFCIPKYFAHGFLVISEETEVLYKVDENYNPDAELGIRWNDADLEIQWPLVENNIESPILSKKDSMLPSYSEISNIYSC